MKRTLTFVFLLELILNINSYAQWNPSSSFAKPTDDTKISSKPGTLQLDLSGHSRHILTTQLSPDGSKLITSSMDGVAIIWEFKSGIKLLTLRPAEYSYFSDVKWSPDGKKIATAGFDGTAVIWSAISGEKLTILEGHTDIVYAIDWNPEGTQVVTGSKDKTAVIWSAASGTKLFTLNNTGEVFDVQWNPDGKKIATRSNNGNADGFVGIWSATTGLKLLGIDRYISENTGIFTDIKWSSDGKKLAVGCRNGACMVWKQIDNDSIYGREYKFIKYEQEIRSVSWSPDGSNVAASYVHGAAIIWDMVKGEQRFILTMSGSMAFTIWSPDGSKIATSGGSVYAVIWDAATGKKLNTVIDSSSIGTERKENGMLACLQWSLDSRKVISSYNSALYNYSVFVWDAETGKLLNIFAGSHWSSVKTVKWSPYGKKIASVGDGSVIVWDATNGVNVNALKIKNRGSSNPKWSPDGLKIITSGKLGYPAVVWDAITGKMIDTIGVAVRDAEWSPDGSKIVTLSKEAYGELTIWDAVTLKKVRHRTSIVSKRVKWHSDGSKLFLSGNSDDIDVMNVETGEDMPGFIGHSKEITDFCLSPDENKIVAVSWDSTVIIWSAITNEKLLAIKANKGLTAVQWSPKGDKIATLSYDDATHSTPVVWSATTGEKLFTLPDHNRLVTAIQWSPNGSNIATASWDSTGIVWSATTGAKLYTLRGHTGSINDIQWSPDGMRIATASDDNSAKIWFASQETDVNEEIPEQYNEVSIYPNPTDNIVNLQFEREITIPTELRVVNILGQQVASFQIPTGTKDQAVSLEGLPTGMYLIKINNTVKTLMKW